MAPVEVEVAAAEPGAAFDDPADAPGVMRLRENERRLNVALSAEHAAILHSRFGKYVTVQRAWDGAGYDLVAGGFVGSVFVGDLRLHILPKVPLTNLFYMLTYAANLAKFRPETTSLAAADDIFEFIVSIFATQVDELVRRGIVRGYIEEEGSLPFLRGRLLLADHLRQTVTRPGTLYQRSTEFTADLRENRIVKATLARLARFDFDDRYLRPRLRRTLSAFSEVSLLDVRPEECDRVIYARLNQRYRSPLALARLLLQRLSLEGHDGATSFAAFLLPVDEVFEAFVSALLRERLAAHPRLTVRPQHRYKLDVDGQLTGKPDNLIGRDGAPALVIDTKYKVYGDKPSEADLYQMATYCHTLRIDRAVLLYPADMAIYDRYRFTSGVTVEAQALPLGGSLAEFQARCAAWVADLFENFKEEEGARA